MTENEIYILNEKNKPITREYIQNMLQKFGINHKIKNLEIYQQAMIHISYLVRDTGFYKNNKTKPYQIQTTEIAPISQNLIKSTIPLQKKSNERLEFLGDSVIHLILADYFFNRYLSEDEGFMTRLRTKLENGDTLSILAKTILLNQYVSISRYVELNGGRETNNKIMEDSFEAFMGALYLDAGFEICKKFLISLVETKIDMAQLLSLETNFKEKLLQYFHLRKWQDPKYGCLNISGAENQKNYTMYVKLFKTPMDIGEIVGQGTSTSKKQAEQIAAQNAMIKFGLYKDSESDSESVAELSDEELKIADSDSLEIIED